MWLTWLTKGQGPLSDRARQRNSTGCLVLFFLIFLITGLVATYFAGIRPLMKVQKAQTWVETPCVVESSGVQSHQGKDSTTYSVDIRYRYTFEGRDYQSSAYGFLSVSSSGYSGKAAIVARYPPGRESVCYVNPSQPGEAVLERRLTPTYLFGLVPLVFVAVGVGGITWAVRKARGQGESPGHGAMRPGIEAARPWTHRPPRFTGAEPFLTDDPVTLKPKQGPVLKLVATVLFALFWNGIVSVFVWQAIKAWGQSGRDGGMEKWFLPLFLIPFVLVGLVILGLAVYYLLALFNPRVRLTLASGRLEPGKRVHIQWSVDGRLDILEELRVSLEGREEATYARGTSTHTDTSVFAKVALATIRDRGQMGSGEAEMEIPPASMPSFESDHNKIAWVVQVQGVIRRWPDIEDEYAVRLLPSPASAIEGPAT